MHSQTHMHQLAHMNAVFLREQRATETDEGSGLIGMQAEENKSKHASIQETFSLHEANTSAC